MASSDEPSDRGASPVASSSRSPQPATETANAVASSSSSSPPASTPTTFAALGVHSQICDAIDALKYKEPTPIQAQAIPVALSGRDVIGLAQTGSGKTAAFAIPILQALWDEPRSGFACVLAPTRELAYQISQQFEALGATIGVRCACIVGGMDMMTQSIALSKRPHIIVATPGRLQDHLENTKGFNLKSLRYLVMDEADRLLDMDFGPIIDKLLQSIPKERNTMLFSATMTTKVAKLQRASLKNPARVEVGTKYSTVSTLTQYYLFLPFAQKDLYLVYLVNDTATTAKSTVIFVRTVHDCARVASLLRILGFPAVPLHGQLSQSSRLAALAKFKAGGRSILVATDVASRGLDIPAVDVVVNFDIPTHSKDYIHRVGRTARAGRSGRSVTLVTQYDVELLQRIETAIETKLTDYGAPRERVALLQGRVEEAAREASREIREKGLGGAGSGKRARRRENGRGDDQDMGSGDEEAGGAGGGGGLPISGMGGKKRRKAHGSGGGGGGGGGKKRR
ncbi:DEAD-domain-containing protein [Jaminaea rosea]|uniref:DEAD-domain-containing protein n=1 Tax=Jaminaea rosea TaxID=1569628 RepID=A0A316UU04_9BASI|nr:DEAD-domain-containing protein [Jaminaea rosea]PWN28780.1 DEAD-domain-containing protein [Jaminaea rosea]